MAILLGSLSGGMQPSAPTIGTATAGDTTASVAFTASSYIGKGTITYTATSSPGGLTATGASSPLTVTGLTNGTAYTFTVVGNTNYGVASVASAASNSVTPALSSFLAYDSIATATVGSGGTSSVTFSSIPQTYKHLQIRGVAKWTVTALDWSNLVFRFNGDTTSSYSYASLLGGQSALGAGVDINLDRGYMQTLMPSSISNPFDNVFGNTVADILEYSSTTKNKSLVAVGGFSAGSYGYSQVGGHTMLNKTSAITQIDIFLDSNNLAQYSSFALYGIKG